MTVDNRYGFGTYESTEGRELPLQAKSYSFDGPYEGYHPFVDPFSGEERGSFRVRYLRANEIYDLLDDGVMGDIEAGWYWVNQHPGSLPDDNYVGPFHTAKEAYQHAQERD